MRSNLRYVGLEARTGCVRTIFQHAPLTDADRVRTIRLFGAAMSALPSEKVLIFLGSFGGPLETRTPDPLIKSQLLYQLS